MTGVFIYCVNKIIKKDKGLILKNIELGELSWISGPHFGNPCSKGLPGFNGPKNEKILDNLHPKNLQELWCHHVSTDQNI